MDNQSFFQHFKFFTSLSSCLHGFWQEVWYNSYACSFVRCSPHSVFLKDAVFVFGFLKLARGRLEWEKCPSPVGIRFQQTLFPCRIVEKTLGIFHNDSSFPPPARFTGGSYSDLYCENLVNFLKLGWGVALCLQSSEVSTLPVVHTHPPAICQKYHFWCSYQFMIPESSPGK